MGAPPRALRPSLEREKRRSQAWQAQQVLKTGFIQESELGNAVYDLLLRRGYTPRRARVGALLAAVPRQYNWQGNRRLAQLARCSERTAQRSRDQLERDELIRSYLLLTGDQLDGQRAPVWHPQVVRHVLELQRRGRYRLGAEQPPAPTSSAHVPRAEVDERVRRIDPEFACYIPRVYTAASAAARATPGDSANVGEGLCSALPDSFPPAPEPSEIDEWERETAELERGPPSERGPPVQQ